MLGVCTDSWGQPSTERVSYEVAVCVCVCVFLGVNVLTRLSDLINTCTATAPLVFMLKLFSDTHVHTHTQLWAVRSATPNVWASRHSTGLPSSLPAASTWPPDTSSSTWPTQLVQSLHNVGCSLAFPHTHKHARGQKQTHMLVYSDRHKQTFKHKNALTDWKKQHLNMNFSQPKIH